MKTRPVRQPGKHTPSSLIQFTTLHLRRARFAVHEAHHTRAISTDAPGGRAAPDLEAASQAIGLLTESRATCTATADTRRCAGATKHSPPIRHAKCPAPNRDRKSV